MHSCNHLLQLNKAYSKKNKEKHFVIVVCNTERITEIQKKLQNGSRKVFIF